MDRFWHTLTVDLGGVVLGMKHAAPVMVGQGSGSIINVASIGGRLGGWSLLDYIVHAFQEEFTAPIGGTHSQQTRDLVRTCRPYSAHSTGVTPCQHQQP